VTLRAEAIGLLPDVLRPERNRTGFLKTTEMSEGYEEFCHVVQNAMRLCAAGSGGRAAWAFQNIAHVIHMGAHALFEPREMLEYTHEIVHAVEGLRRGQWIEPILDIACNAAWMAASASEVVHWLEEVNVIELAGGCARLGSAMGITLCLATVVEGMGDGYQLALQLPLVDRLEQAVAIAEDNSPRKEALSEALRLARRDRKTLIVNLVKNAFLFAWSITGLVAYRSRVVSALLGISAAGLGFWRHWYNGSLDQVRARAVAATGLLENQSMESMAAASATSHAH
jgi:hypothetical protein